MKTIILIAALLVSFEAVSQMKIKLIIGTVQATDGCAESNFELLPQDGGESLCLGFDGVHPDQLTVGQVHTVEGYMDPDGFFVTNVIE